MNGKKSTAGNSVLSVFTGNTGIIGVLVILCVVVALATDKFLTPSNIIQCSDRFPLIHTLHWE